MLIIDINTNSILESIGEDNQIFYTTKKYWTTYKLEVIPCFEQLERKLLYGENIH